MHVPTKLSSSNMFFFRLFRWVVNRVSWFFSACNVRGCDDGCSGAVMESRTELRASIELWSWIVRNSSAHWARKAQNSTPSTVPSCWISIAAKRLLKSDSFKSPALLVFRNSHNSSLEILPFFGVFVYSLELIGEESIWRSLAHWSSDTNSRTLGE